MCGKNVQCDRFHLTFDGAKSQTTVQLHTTRLIAWSSCRRAASSNIAAQALTQKEEIAGHSLLRIRHARRRVEGTSDDLRWASA